MSAARRTKESYPKAVGFDRVMKRLIADGDMKEVSPGEFAITEQGEMKVAAMGRPARTLWHVDPEEGDVGVVSEGSREICAVSWNDARRMLAVVDDLVVSLVTNLALYTTGCAGCDIGEQATKGQHTPWCPVGMLLMLLSERGWTVGASTPQPPGETIRPPDEPHHENCIVFDGDGGCSCGADRRNGTRRALRAEHGPDEGS